MATLPALEIRDAHGGRGVFAAQKIARRRRILEFTGPLYQRRTIEQLAADGEHDLYLQVGPEHFMGPSGGADDLVNHSCEPNCRLNFTRQGVWLQALHRIIPGEELSFDYGAAQIAFPFRFQCACGKSQCRGEIGNFDEIPASIAASYLERGVFPRHIRMLIEAGEFTQLADTQAQGRSLTSGFSVGSHVTFNDFGPRNDVFGE